VDLFQHAAKAYKVVVKDLLGCIQQLENAFIADCVIDVCAILASYHDVPVAQHSKLLGGIRRLNLKKLTNLIDCQLALPQSIEDGYSQRMSESLEEVCFKVA